MWVDRSLQDERFHLWGPALPRQSVIGRPNCDRVLGRVAEQQRPEGAPIDREQRGKVIVSPKTPKRQQKARRRSAPVWVVLVKWRGDGQHSASRRHLGKACPQFAYF